MKIEVRRTHPFRDVAIVDGNTRIELGLLNQDECMTLAKELKDGISDLLGDDDYAELMEMK